MANTTNTAEPTKTDAKPAKVQPLDRAKEMADEVAGKARQTIETTREKLHTVGDEVGKRYEKLSDDVGKRYEKLSDDVRRGAERASTVARERYDETSETFKKGYTKVRKDLDGLTKDVNTYVRDNPGKSVLIAAGAGFLLGLLFRGSGNDQE